MKYPQIRGIEAQKSVGKIVPINNVDVGTIFIYDGHAFVKTYSPPKATSEDCYGWPISFAVKDEEQLEFLIPKNAEVLIPTLVKILYSK